MTGDISIKCSTKARSSASNLSASRSSSQVVRLAEATIFFPAVLGGGEFGPLRALFNPSGNDALHRATKADSNPLSVREDKSLMAGLQARRREVNRAVDNFSLDEGIQREISIKYAC